MVSFVSHIKREPEGVEFFHPIFEICQIISPDILSVSGKNHVGCRVFCVEIGVSGIFTRQ